ncbi:hypothetical protein [Duganella phyllosphaerae]|uniref:Uncharacterized protein n=1 Tax=Duganella phyllosphaerae TaxID=762836 RepID=A0A1E7W4N1_9BURK|nr:hypothetical protein [Duganella phyllosphaerae]OEZ90720.1 hypothetical protein DUPY_53270 [Duganella phyllosphaerae]
MIFEKPFTGVPNGEIYPISYEPGQDCPPELLDAAKELGAVAGDDADAKTASKKVPAK